jgi:hypothetical protein
VLNDHALIEQLCKDLNQAHDELMVAQGCKRTETGKYDWPEWTPQANSIRIAEKLLGKRLAKTEAWTLYPALTPWTCGCGHYNKASVMCGHCGGDRPC